MDAITQQVEQKAVKREKNSIREQKSGVAFAAGQVFTNMLSTVLIAKAQTMPSIASLIKTFVYGLKKVTTHCQRELPRALNSEVQRQYLPLTPPCRTDQVDENRNLRISHILLQIPIPAAALAECRTYGELVVYMLNQKDHDIPIGLYRAPDPHRGNSSPYVFTNPKPSVELAPGDRLFVLANSSLAMAGTRRPPISNIAGGTELPPAQVASEEGLDEGDVSLPRFGGMVSPGFNPQ